jgi:hypothetical protein
MRVCSLTAVWAWMEAGAARITANAADRRAERLFKEGLHMGKGPEDRKEP